MAERRHLSDLPKEFPDTTGSGTGDLRGVTQRPDYLKTLGIDAIWLTPFYISPQVDNGYDVANYTAIDPTYGTLDDFDELVARAHERGIRIVLDMVFNHTSTQHARFRESLDKASPYRQFYIWRDGTPDTLPNNLRSKFGGNAGAGTPKANSIICTCSHRSRRISTGKTGGARRAEKSVRVLGRSRRGRLASGRHQPGFKDQDFPDDTLGDGRRFYTDGPRIHEYLQEMSRDVFTPRNLMTVGEMSSTSLENCQQYASLDGRELSMTFNFHHLKVDYPGGENGRRQSRTSWR